MNLLLTIQRFCKRTGLNEPVTVIGNTDPQVQQILSLLEEEGNDLSGRGDWNELTNEATHTTVATESQGAITAIATNGFRYIKNDTAWDRTQELPLAVISGSDWQAEIATSRTNFLYQVRLRGGLLISTPVPPAGHTWAFEYVTWNWITDSAGINPTAYFADDTDLMVLPEAILMMGLRWRWKKEKGFEYAEDLRTYELLVADALTRDGLNKPLSMSKRRESPRPKIAILDTWSV